MLEVLGQARELGFLGPGPIELHIDHAMAYAKPLGEGWSGRAVDLGSGGGVPGLVLALVYPDSEWTLVDAQERRATFLASAISSLSLEKRVYVMHERAEVFGRDPIHRHTYDLVVARSFSAPPVTAECASPLLKKNALLVVSEPPAGEGVTYRWPEVPLALLGLQLENLLPGPPALALIRSRELCEEKYPRRTGIPSKRPLW
ncbi:MAG: 16S rRNA (guanine(527)-N(7))-methyltransferase RsmG [Acidimicrobiales bacterium]